MTHRELKVALACFLGTCAGQKRVDDILLDPAQHGAKDILAVPKAAIDGGSVGTGRLGYGAHGESLFRSLFPELLGSVQNTFLQIRIGQSWHFCPLNLHKTI
jgi:hypothetical protein